MSKRIEDLCGPMQEIVRKAIDEMNKDTELNYLGVDYIAISETARSLPVQMAYFARGRMSICDVRAMYEAAGLYCLTDAECKQIVTWTLKSKHLSGKAIDLVPVIKGKTCWNPPERVWQAMGEIGKKHGLKWGGDWKEKDYPHFEID